jgi:hypothetical protein
MGLSGCKIYSADEVAQNFDERRGNICVRVQLRGLSSRSNDKTAQEILRAKGIKCIGAWRWSRPVVVRGVASSSSQSSVAHGQELFARLEQVNVQ